MEVRPKVILKQLSKSPVWLGLQEDLLALHTYQAARSYRPGFQAC